jgi:hypothetical protein
MDRRSDRIFLHKQPQREVGENGKKKKKEKSHQTNKIKAYKFFYF